jgi:hypothetical protein
MATDAELLRAYTQALDVAERFEEGAAEGIATRRAAVNRAAGDLVMQLMPAGLKNGDRVGLYVRNDLVLLISNGGGAGSGTVERVIPNAKPPGGPAPTPAPVP